MTLAPFTTGIFAAGVLAGLAVAVLAATVPDLPQAIRDLRRRPTLPEDGPTTLQVERAISKRLFRSLTILATISALVFLAAFAAA
jgi:hypothetical protein